MTGGPPPVSIERIKQGLEARARELVHHLLPNARAEGPEFFVGSLAGEPGRSLAINWKARPGIWCDFATGEAGDAIDLVAAVLFRGDKREAIAWARSWTGLDGLDPGRLKVTRQAVAQKQVADEGRLSDDERAEKARRLWRGAKASGRDLLGTPVDAYLKGRGVDLRHLPRLPGALAFAPACWNPEKRAPLPAMLAAIQHGKQVLGVHRTWLAQQPDGRWTKAALANAKMSLGQVTPGVIALSRGASARRWADLWDAELDADWPETDADRCVTLTEGIEDALSLAMADPARRVVCCISLAAMGSVALPPCLQDVTIAADNDPVRSAAAAKGLPRAVKHLQAEGRTVRIARPPAAFKDFNDWLRALGSKSQGEAA